MYIGIRSLDVFIDRWAGAAADKLKELVTKIFRVVRSCGKPGAVDLKIREKGHQSSSRRIVPRRLTESCCPSHYHLMTGVTRSCGTPTAASGGIR